MLGRKERSQLELFISGSLRQLIPDDHMLVRVERVLDLSWLRSHCCNSFNAATAASFNPQNRFARKSPSKGQNPANSITCARPVIQPIQWLLNFSRTTTLPATSSSLN